jgi:hypothetical protein
MDQSDSPLRHFPDGLEPLRPLHNGASFESPEGKRFLVWSTVPAVRPNRGGLRNIMHYRGKYVSEDREFDDTSFSEGYRFFELRDAANGRVVLPLDYHKFVVVPGAGLFVLPADQRTRRPDDRSISNQNRGPWHTRLMAHGDRPASRQELLQWKWFDPAAERLVDTDVVLLESYWSVSKPAPPPAWLIVRWRPNESGPGGKELGRLDAEVISPSGDAIGQYERFAPQFEYNYNGFTTGLVRAMSARGMFAVLGTHTANGGRQDYLLGNSLELVSIPAARVVAVGDSLATQAPGTDTAEELWYVLQRDGTFAAPPRGSRAAGGVN